MARIDRLLGSVALTALLAAPPGAALAAGGPNEIQEIVITAQKRTENIQQVPIAVTAFTAEALQDKSITDVQKLGNLTPGVNFDQSSPFSGSNEVLSASIRGIGQDDFAFNLDPGVGVYVDGVYLARTVGANQNLLDVERVEVLKGPQGTLFGRNTIGGAISIVTRDPGPVFKGEVQGTTGSFDRRDFAATADIPILDNLLSSITVSSNQRDGYQKLIPDPNAAGTLIEPYSKFHNAGLITHDTAGAHDDQTIRAKLVFKPTTDLKFTLTADWQHVDTSATPNTVLRTFNTQANGAGSLLALYNACAAGAPIPPCTIPLGPDFAGSSLSQGPREFFPVGSFPAGYTGNIDTAYAGPQNFDKLDSFGGSFTIDYAIDGNLAIKSITGWRRVLWQAGINSGGLGAYLLTPNFNEGQHQESEEVQLIGHAFDDRLNYVAGAYYFSEGGYIHDYPVFAGGLLQIDGNNRLDTDSYAGFVHADYKLLDQVKLIFGARYSVEEKSFEGFQTDQDALSYRGSGCYPTQALAASLGFPAGPGVTCQQFLGFSVPGQPLRYFPAGVNHQNYYLFNPTAGIQYQFTPDLMSYFTYSKGFKSGGWTTRLSSPIADARLAQFGPEKDESYEIGAKSQWFNHHLVVDWAAYYSQYTGIQLNFQEGISPTLKNAGNADIYGTELETRAILGDGFTLSANAAYIYAYYTYLAPGTGLAATNDNPLALPSGTKLPKTPKWKFDISPEYDYDLPNGSTLRFLVDWTHVSSIFNDSYNTPELRRPTVDLLGVSVQFVSPDDRYEIIVGGTNITDERYVTTGQNQQGGGLIYATFSEPSEWYLTGRIKF